MKKLHAVAGMFAVWVLLAPPVSAEIIFSGDARARLIYRDNYDFGNSDQSGRTNWDSRVRFNFKGVSDGGAYAVSRIRLVDTTWSGPTDAADAKNIWADKAYVGVPMGSALLEAGYMKSDITKFLEWDQSVARARLDYVLGEWTVSGLADVQRDGGLSGIEVDRIQDNDWMVYGLLLHGTVGDRFSTALNLFFSDDSRDEFATGEYVPDQSGFFGSVYAKGVLAGLTVESEIAYRDFDALQSREERSSVYRQQGEEDDGLGWYGKAWYALGSVTTTLNVGFALNGFEADNDFGWIMTGNGNNEPIAVFNTVGGTGDWYWVAPSISWAVSERLSIDGNFVFVNIDGNDAIAVDDKRLAKLYEVSGAVTYAVSDGAAFIWKIGYLQPDFDGRIDGVGVEDDAAFGTYGSVQIAF